MNRNDVLGYLLVLGYNLKEPDLSIARENLLGSLLRVRDQLEATYPAIAEAVAERERLNVQYDPPCNQIDLDIATHKCISLLLPFLKQK